MYLLLQAVMEMTGLLGSLPSYSLQSPSVPSGTRHLDPVTWGHPEGTAEAPILSPNLHGAWPTSILHPSPSLGLDLLPLTGHPAGSTALLDKGFLCLFVVSGRGWNRRKLGSSWALCKGTAALGQGSYRPLGGSSFGKDNRIRFDYFPKYILKETFFRGR